MSHQTELEISNIQRNIEEKTIYCFEVSAAFADRLMRWVQHDEVKTINKVMPAISSYPTGENGRYFADDIFKRIYLNEKTSNFDQNFTEDYS